MLLQMEPGEARKLDEFVSTTAFIMRLFIFMLVGAQVDFGLMGQYLWGGVAVVTVLMLLARPVTVFACALPDQRARWSFAKCCSCAGRARPASFPVRWPACCSA